MRKDAARLPFLGRLILAIACCALILTVDGVQTVLAADISTMVWREPVFGGKLFVRQAGVDNPQLLLLVHGLGDDAGEIWQELISRLAVDYHVVVPDLPGFGRSTKGNHLYSPENYSNLLFWLIAQLPPKKVSLVGHSLGGAIALYYAALHPENLQRLVLVDSEGLLHRLAVSQYFARRQLKLDFPLWPSLDTAMGRGVGMLIEKASRLPLEPGYLLSSPTLRQQLLGEPGRIAGLALVETDFSLLLGRVKTPTWLLWGAEDTIAPRRIAAILQWRLPRVGIRIFPGQGHSPMRENGSKFLGVLRDCLATLPASHKQLSVPDVLPDRVLRRVSGQVVSGFYNSLRIESCEDLELRQVWARHLEIVDSRVHMTSSTVAAGSAGVAINISRSSVVMTGVDLSGKTGIVSNQSRLDIAGMEYQGEGMPIQATGHPSSVLLSSSTSRRKDRLKSLHLSRTLRAGESL